MSSMEFEDPSIDVDGAAISMTGLLKTI